jgi:8-oxo-dGTP pyrophosphatase MutT (NUDIX family)
MRWIIRVYALCVGPGGTYLVLEEYFRGGWILKFPGGGVERGEGLRDALARELKEELGVSLLRSEHFYTTDFFQRSYYHQDAQLLSVYYRVWLSEEPRVCSPRLKLYWLPPHLIQTTFPVDRYVVSLLQREG